MKCYNCNHERKEHHRVVGYSARCFDSGCDCLGFNKRNLKKERLMAEMKGFKFNVALAKVGKSEAAWRVEK